MDIWEPALAQHEFDPILHLEIAELELPAQGLHRLYRAVLPSHQERKPRPGVVDYLESAQEMGKVIASGYP